AGFSPERVDGLDDFRVNLPGENLIDHLDSLLIGNALPLDEPGLQPRFLHRPRDGFAAPMHDYRIDFDGFQKDDVPGHAVPNGVVRRVHETAAVFDHEHLAAIALNVRQRFEQGGSFGDWILHVEKDGQLYAP